MKRVAMKAVIILLAIAPYVIGTYMQPWLEARLGASLAKTILAVYPLLAGAVIGIELSDLVAVFNARKSTFSGYYRDEIYSAESDDEERIIKRDAFYLQEKRDRVFSGPFFRYYPCHSEFAHWQCSGFIVADQVLLAYRAKQETTPSRGVILLRQDTLRKHGLEPRFSGSYFKFQGDRVIEHRINLVKISKKEYKEIMAMNQSNMLGTHHGS